MSELRHPGGTCSTCGEECDRRRTLCRVCDLTAKLEAAKLEQAARKAARAAYLKVKGQQPCSMI